MRRSAQQLFPALDSVKYLNHGGAVPYPAEGPSHPRDAVLATVARGDFMATVTAV